MSSLRRRLIALGIALGGLLSPSVARADSDGYYCVGPDYIAYEFGGASTRVPHMLHVVRLTRDGLRDSLRVQLPSFQVHDLKCTADAVYVASFKGSFTIPLDQQRRPGTPVEADTTFRVPMSVPANIGDRGYRPGSAKYGTRTRVSIAKLNDSEFVIEFLPSDVKPQACVATVTVSILMLDPPGRTAAAKRVFRGTHHRACGE